jgi:hypothetical protein
MPEDRFNLCFEGSIGDWKIYGNLRDIITVFAVKR